MLRKLEANECDVDDDSILAPFSQKDEKTEVILSQQQPAMPFGPQANGSHPTNPTTTDQHYLDEDDDLLNEFSKNLDDLLAHEMYVQSIARLQLKIIISISVYKWRYHKWMEVLMSHRNEIGQNFSR